MKTLSQGAEAIIETDGKIVIKKRIPKEYRHPDLDNELRKFRTRREAKILVTLAKSNFPTAKLFKMSDKDMQITMQFLAGPQVKEVLHTNPEKYGKEIGSLLARLHKQNIIHGDLTTSNMILVEKKDGTKDLNEEKINEKGITEIKKVDSKIIDSKKDKLQKKKNIQENIHFIDFGLSFTSTRMEDKAVDLHVLKQALESKHYKIFEKCYKSVLQGYTEYSEYKEVIKRLEIVESRGRNRH